MEVRPPCWRLRERPHKKQLIQLFGIEADRFDGIGGLGALTTITRSLLHGGQATPDQRQLCVAEASGGEVPPLAFASGLRRTAGISSWEAACWEGRPGPLNTSGA